MYIINLLGSASPSCVSNLSCSGTRPAVTFEVQRMYDQHFIEVPECISIFNFSAVNVFPCQYVVYVQLFAFEVW